MRAHRTIRFALGLALLALSPSLYAKASTRDEKGTRREAAHRAHTAQAGARAKAPAPPPGASRTKPLAVPGEPAATKHEAAPPPAVRSTFTPSPLSLPVQKASLDNGLRVVMLVDHTSPTVAISVTYDIGSRNEQPGRSGFAHLFEHMMFEGSANVPKGEHFRLVSSHGGTLNGTTSGDRTEYFEVLPSNELALALWLEADRMKSLDISQENFENQRKVVEEEYRMRVSNVPYAPAQIRFQELVFKGYWPYEHSSIGSMQDLDGARLEWVKAFHDSYYAPNLAVLSIAGDFDSDEAMQLVHRFFDTAKKEERAPSYTPPEFVEPTGPRSLALEDDHAKTPAVFYGWPIPPARDVDHYALEVAVGVLGDGESSRLHQRLVRDKALAQDTGAWTQDHRGPDMAAVHVKLAQDARLSDTEKALDAEIDRLAKEGPTEAELLKLRSRIDASFVFGLQSNLGRAERLAEFELFYGDARQLAGEPAKYFAVTRDDVKRVVAKYLRPERRTTVEVRPAGVSDPPARAAVVPRAEPAPTGAKKGAKTQVLSKAALAKEREGGTKKHKRHKEPAR